ncbi:MAG: aspartate kinase [Bacillota bacterium]|jgi:aspartate kinase|nr:aspartate kinase [Bacillota bacterium]NLU54450.1 aspartate kinase [Bacillota bacterium]HOA91133.1 aspartate kinase [Bacillota bacterium]HPQ10157.1 aspartate kinase [Bacillota bacterium]HPT60722.1 aspartate kinase [Bacillota bacterium]
MALIVQKYGGTSVADATRVRDVAERVLYTQQKGNQMVIVVSAPAGKTDELLALARGVAKHPNPREVDMLLATGEQISIALLAMAIADLGGKAISLTAAQVGIKTDGTHQKAKITEISLKRIKEELEKGQVVIVAGFQGIDEKHDYTTLGRGGSDTSAVALAAALNADMCEIYTDVDGVYTADPRLVPNAKKHDEISYDEMLEMASLGAKVLHLRAVELAKKYNVPLHVRSSFNENPGTVVKGGENMEQGRIVVGVAHNSKISKLTIARIADKPGVAAMIFSKLAAADINVDMIVQSAGKDGLADISFTVSKDDADRAEEVARSMVEVLSAESVERDDNQAKVSIVGTGMLTNPGVAAAMFETLAQNNINIEMISTSDISISTVIPGELVEKAVQALHSAFELDK